MFRENFYDGKGIFRLEVLDDGDFGLAFIKRGEILVEYRPGWRVAGGHAAAYEFKSVEKLRYDFERDVEDALHQA